MTDSRVPGIMNWWRSQSTGQYEVKIQARHLKGEDGEFVKLEPPGPDWFLVSFEPASEQVVLLAWGRQKTVGDVLDEKRANET